MRVILSIILMSILAGCNATTHEDSSQSITAKLTSQLRSSKFYHDPMMMAKRVTNDVVVRHSLKVGDFKRYDVSTLEVLAKVKMRFDDPGKSIIYQSTYMELAEISKKIKNSNQSNKPETNSRISNRHKAFLKKLEASIISITEKETSQAAACAADYTWNDFPSNQMEIFNKMVLGTELTPEETVSLTYNPPDKVSKGIISKSVSCLLVSLGLFDQFKALSK